MILNKPEKHCRNLLMRFWPNPLTSMSFRSLNCHRVLVVTMLVIALVVTMADRCPKLSA
jgi:hypothetical protein